MSCLLNALTTKSNLNNPNINEPDSKEFLGYELGTWTYAEYLKYFEQIAGENITKMKKHPNFFNKIEIYTPEACQKITNELKKVIAQLPKGKLSRSLLTKSEIKKRKNWSGLGKPPIYPKRNPLLLTHSKWYKKLLQIFESNEAVFYCK